MKKGLLLIFTIYLIVSGLSGCVNEPAPASTPSLSNTESPENAETPKTLKTPDVVVPKTVLYDLPSNFLINADTTPEMTFGQTWEESETYTICDFCIMSDNSILILDSKTGRIFRFGDNKVIKIYDYDLSPNYLPNKIACDSSGNIYLGAAKHNYLLRVDANDDIHFSKFNGPDLAATQAFSARNDGKVVVNLPNLESDASTMLIIDISGPDAVITETGTRFITSEFLYIAKHIVDPGDTKRQVGHSFSLKFYDFNLAGIADIIISSENWILGGTCYGKSGDKYLIELIEVDDTNNFYDYLALVDSSGTIVNRYNIPQSGELKSFGGVLFLFTQTNEQIQIKEAFSVLSLRE